MWVKLQRDIIDKPTRIFIFRFGEPQVLYRKGDIVKVTDRDGDIYYDPCSAEINNEDIWLGPDDWKPFIRNNSVDGDYDSMAHSDVEGRTAQRRSYRRLSSSGYRERLSELLCGVYNPLKEQVECSG